VRANSGVGFAIPIAIVARVVPGLIENGRYEHSYMGISGVTFSPICSDEQITAVNGISVGTFDDILIYLARYTSPGDDLTLTVVRDGEPRDIVLNLAARPNR
jgi:S1-C subfamily serine protease